ncbi:PIN domain-containing protein [Neorhizobium lilium]|uniref:PIN domain-containing protein n=1 Tax=Neorhizobium lilium TaxID=2503024 RepID=A0A3S3U0J9_9HYPH|nr:PIN domain-containing protein [Neorhizobium lilium]RWX79117.1 PIN domain-containing protein [Neorhizobium lilium]
MPGNFYDTNILLYLASGEVEKAEAAEKAVSLGGTISVQVLNEFAHVARRKLQFSWAETRDFLSTVQGLLTVVPLTVTLHERGLEIAERYGFSIYDSMILAASLESGCDVLFTEDLQDGMQIEGLSIINPLRKSS